MDFQYTEKMQTLITQVRDFINNEIRPAENVYYLSLIHI